MKEIDLTPRGIIKRLDLRRPIYRKTAAYGHFGRNEKEFTWEKLDLIKNTPKSNQVNSRSIKSLLLRNEKNMNHKPGNLSKRSFACKGRQASY